MVLIREEEHETREAGDVELELVEPDGDIVARTSSEFDGFFVFERVPFGVYEVTMSLEQSERLNLELPEGVRVELSLENDIIEGLELIIHTGATEPAL